MLGGGRGGRIRGAISRSLVVVVMGLGVEGRLGAAPLGVGSTGSVEDGTVVGSTAIGVVVSRGDSLDGISEPKSARGGMACVTSSAHGMSSKKNRLLVCQSNIAISIFQLPF